MTRGRRLGLELVLLPVLYLASLPDPDTFVVAMSWVLVLTPAVNWTVAAILVWSARQARDVETLAERADDAVTLGLMSTGGALAGLVTIVRTFGFEVDGRPVVALLAWVLVLVSVPAIGWLQAWRRYWLPIVRNRMATAEEPATPREGTP